MEQILVSYRNKILGRVINTQTKMVATPPDYVASTVLLLKKHWHNRRQRFLISDIEALVGQLGHISETTPWLRFLLSHVYSSVAYALKLSKAHLLGTRKEFRLMINTRRFQIDAT